MPNVTIKGISEDTLRIIKKKAASNNRSLNKEIIDLLTKYALMKPPQSKILLREIDKFKHVFKGKLSAASITRGIRQGRK